MQWAQVYTLQGKFDDALGVYQKALAVAPNSPTLMQVIGDVYLMKNDVKSAQQYYEKGNSLAPHDPLLQNDLAWVYAMQGQNLDQALSLATQAKTGLISNDTPVYAIEGAKLDQALALTTQARETAPELISVNDTLGWIQYKKGNYSIAVGLLSEVVQKAPQNAEYRYHLGMALSGAGKKDKAKEELSKALQLAPPLNRDDAKQAQDALAKL
jgi:Flp pilus assembly protein TadD